MAFNSALKTPTNARTHIFFFSLMVKQLRMKIYLYIRDVDQSDRYQINSK